MATKFVRENVQRDPILYKPLSAALLEKRRSDIYNHSPDWWETRVSGTLGGILDKRSIGPLVSFYQALILRKGYRHKKSNLHPEVCTYLPTEIST